MDDNPQAPHGGQLTVLITGAAGFIGAATALRLLERGEEVIGLDNLNSYYDPALKRGRLARIGTAGGQWKFMQHDLEDRSAIAALFADSKPKAVVHRLFNIGNSQPKPLMRFVELLEKALGKEAIKDFQPTQPCDFVATASDTSALEAWVGFQPKTPLEVGLKRFAKWVKQYPELIGLNYLPPCNCLSSSSSSSSATALSCSSQA